MSEAPISPQKAAELLLKRRRARESFLDFAKLIMPDDMQPQEHHALIAKDLQDLAEGVCRRQMLVLPPGSAKSTYASWLFPTYFLGLYPKASVIAASHTAAFAERFGRRCRNLINEDAYRAIFPGTSVASDSAAAGQWSTTQGGEYMAIGAGGRVQGRRADLLIVDDPIGSREDADSELIREQLWQWYTYDLAPRLKPGARVIVCQTRYHMEDLAGRLLDKEPERWKLLHLPMEYEEGLPNPLGLK
ncbi:MAG TPA: terminase family protein, partial [Aquabacterium sp.]|nr:terminase family protein [Aquabacterium sp.]